MEKETTNVCAQCGLFTAGEWSNLGYKMMLRVELFPKLKFNDKPIEVEIVEKQ